MEMVHLMDRMGSVPILSINRTVSIGTMLYFDGDGDARVNRPLVLMFVAGSLESAN